MRVFCSVVVWHFGSVGAAFVSRVALVQGPLYTSHNTQLHRALLVPLGNATKCTTVVVRPYNVTSHTTHSQHARREGYRIP